MKETLQTWARDAEGNDDHELAATAFFTLGAYSLSAANYRDGKQYREGIGFLLRSIEHDVRSGNAHRATRTASFVRRHIDPLVDSSNDEVIQGLGYEWAGDALLMTGADARPKYKEALTRFETLDLDTQLHWGARPEYDSAFLPMKRYYEQQGLEYFDDHDIDFEGRVAWKLTTLERTTG